jgi:hypothetical protein
MKAMNKSTSKLEALKQAVLLWIEREGIEAAEKEYFNKTIERNARQRAREIFSNLEQDTITGQWRFKTP